MTRTILDEIVTTKRRELAESIRLRPLDDVRRAADDAPPTRDFHSAVADGGAGPIRLIAEIKRRSPSAGPLRPDLRPADVATIYEESGAAALSVLTDARYFGGALDDIGRARSATRLPVLRKDFMLDAYGVYEARAAGADAVLLISGILSAARIDEYSAIAGDLGMASVVEVHRAEELAAVLPIIGAGRGAILGINNRDLALQRTDLATTESLAAALPGGTPFISESGIHEPQDVRRIRRAGASAILVGEALLRADDIGKKIKELLDSG